MRIEVNIMTIVYATRLGLAIRITDISAQKIDGSFLKTQEMITAGFLLQDRLEKIGFFEKTFLLIDISIKIVLKMLFLFFSKRNI